LRRTTRFDEVSKHRDAGDHGDRVMLVLVFLDEPGKGRGNRRARPEKASRGRSGRRARRSPGPGRPRTGSAEAPAPGSGRDSLGEGPPRFSTRRMPYRPSQDLFEARVVAVPGRPSVADAHHGRRSLFAPRATSFLRPDRNPSPLIATYAIHKSLQACS
jgi:hypothetical protein